MSHRWSQPDGNAGDSDTGRKSPGDIDSFETDRQTAAAVALLIQGAPENGIDLVPTWERMLAREDAARAVEAPNAILPHAVTSGGRGFSVRSLIGYAAVLLIGCGLGAVAIQRADMPIGMPILVSEPEREHYTNEQRDLMFLVLRAAEPPTQPLANRALRELSACIACHETSLGQRLEAWQR